MGRQRSQSKGLLQQGGVQELLEPSHREEENKQNDRNGGNFSNLKTSMLP